MSQAHKPPYSPLPFKAEASPVLQPGEEPKPPVPPVLGRNSGEIQLSSPGKWEIKSEDPDQIHTRQHKVPCD
ncbi:hypothetical protein PtB15_11B344 [Puccinia triticina]|nr:hypothetical protein PtB15_11B344 [Puccinia triticina]